MKSFTLRMDAIPSAHRSTTGEELVKRGAASRIRKERRLKSEDYTFAVHHVRNDTYDVIITERMSRDEPA